MGGGAGRLSGSDADFHEVVRRSQRITFPGHCYSSNHRDLITFQDGECRSCFLIGEARAPGGHMVWKDQPWRCMILIFFSKVRDSARSFRKQALLKRSGRS